MDQVAARKRLAELAAELCLPMPPDITDSDVSEDVIREAVADQIDCIESRVPKMNGMVLKKWKDRGKMVLPLFFHTPVGREWIRRLVFAARFGTEQMALMLGVRAAQLSDYIKGQGWDRQVLAVEREIASAEYVSKFKALLYEGKYKTMKAAVKLTGHIGDLQAEQALQKIPELRQLHEIMLAVDPPPVEGQAFDPSGLHAVNVGVQIVSHQKKKFDPAEAAKKAKAAEVNQPQIESD